MHFIILRLCLLKFPDLVPKLEPYFMAFNLGVKLTFFNPVLSFFGATIGFFFYFFIPLLVGVDFPLLLPEDSDGTKTNGTAILVFTGVAPIEFSTRLSMVVVLMFLRALISKPYYVW